MKSEPFNQFIAEGYSHIPVYSEILSDLETPLSLFMKLANRPYTYLFESVQGGEKWARYSMLGLQTHDRIEIRGQQISEIRAGQTTACFEHDDPLQYLETVRKRYHTPVGLPELPLFRGGLVGFFAYDCVHLIEPKLQAGQQADTLDLPDVLLMLSTEVVVLDNLSGKAYLIIMAEANTESYVAAKARLAELLAQVHNSTLNYQPLALNTAEKTFPLQHSIPHADFLQKVATIKDYIIAGDAFQVVLSQRMSLPFVHSPLDLYRVLRTLNPSPYMYYLDLGDYYIVGASPEILVRFEEGIAQVRPIAGTRKRGKTPAEDQALEVELLADPKERAEHLMLIDLGRNDIGRIAKPGKVTVNEQFVVERYSHVMHIVSNVIGEVQDGLNAIDVLKSVFPAGTLSGAPKFRAMDIITELEPVKRHVYGGAIGYISWHGNMDTAITIRTAVIKGGQLHVQAGAGIVYDSQPEAEWQESLNKAQAILKALAMLERQ